MSIEAIESRQIEFKACGVDPSDTVEGSYTTTRIFMKNPLDEMGGQAVESDTLKVLYDPHLEEIYPASDEDIETYKKLEDEEYDIKDYQIPEGRLEVDITHTKIRKI